MRYDMQQFDEAVDYYKKILSAQDFRSAMITGIFSKNAFLSIAPLSKAFHELDKDLFVCFTDKEWDDPTFSLLINPKTDKLQEFINDVDSKTNNDFKRIFNAPKLILRSGEKQFEGKITLDFKPEWYKEIKKDLLWQTADSILENVLAPKKEETMSINFTLIPKKPSLPLDDYLDSFGISLAVFDSSKEKVKLLKVCSGTSKDSMLDIPEPVSELITTITGCEYSKDIDEPIFRLYKQISEEYSLHKIIPADVVFGIRGEGYPGKHFFGESIGYPTPNKKTRWTSPSSMRYKFSWYPQSKVDSRPPSSRIGFTETVPIEVFIDSVLIDYPKMRSRNRKIKELMDDSDSIIVKSNIEEGSDFKVDLIKKDNTRRLVMGSDSDARNLINPNFPDDTFGMMANIPGGETFTTPENLTGKIVGDVVISLDRSYRLSPLNPLKIIAEKEGYKVIDGEKKIIDQLEKKKKDAWKKLEEQEKQDSIPKELIALKKANFQNIGEFAINTNPKAKLCDYLIVNEKIAHMIHIALGSGFEPDKASEYHTDIVIDSPRQKLDIYGIKKDGKINWIMKQGRFVI